MYDVSAWTLEKNLESKLDGTYNRMLRAIHNISMCKYPNKSQFCQPIPDISTILRERRMGLW